MNARTHPPLRGVLFDLDGVLVDSLPVMRMALEAAYRDSGAPDAAEADFDALFAAYRQHLGKGFPAILRALDLPPDLHPHFKRHSRQLVAYVHPCRGVGAMLQQLTADGWVMGVATGKDEARACELLERLHLRHHFRMVMGCDSVASPKPAPDMVAAFVAATGVPLDRLVMVGDAPVDLQCARRAGCRGVAALWGFTPPGPLLDEGPCFTARSPADLLSWLEVQP